MSYANVAATLALFLAVTGGIAWALETNSVKSKHIVNGQVKTGDLADDAVTGVDIAEDTLAEVPQAFTAVNAQSAEQADNAALLDTLDSSAFAKAEGANFTDAGLPPIDCASLPDGWYDAAGRPVGYHRDPFGIVHLQGAFDRCGDVPGPAFTLPAGYRPAVQSDFPVAGGAGFSTVGLVQITASGQVFGNGMASVRGALDGLAFRCGPSGQDGCP